LELKRKRKEELMAELKELGLDVPRVSTTASSGEGAKKKGRPKGSKLSPEIIQRMKDGRAKAKAAREGKNVEPALPMDTTYPLDT
jgi:hypothetical protein